MTGIASSWHAWVPNVAIKVRSWSAFQRPGVEPACVWGRLAPARTSATTPSSKGRTRRVDMCVTSPRSARDCKLSPRFHREGQLRLDDVAVDREDAEADGVAAGHERGEREGQAPRILGRDRDVAQIDLDARLAGHGRFRVRR